MSNRIKSRYEHAKESFKSAGECIGEIKKNMHLFAITRGQWSMIDAILYCLDCVGRSKISLWTWTVAKYEVEVLNRLMVDSRLSSGLLVIDRGALNKNKEIIGAWKKEFGSESVRYVVNHAKIATIESDSGYKLLLRGSMNLNFNPRFENFDISENCGGFDIVKQIETELPILNDNCSGQDVYNASKVSQSFNKEQLNMFSNVKVWNK